MYQFNFFDRNWLNVDALFDDGASLHTDIIIDLDKTFFQSLKLDKESCKNYLIEAANKCSEMLGDNPALCLSGGIDSQAMLYAFYIANVKFKVYTFVYNDQLNAADVSLAQIYCKRHNIELIEIPFNIISFLTRENFDYGIKYKSASPHFNAHYKFCDILKDIGHTGVCFGGNTPFSSRNGFDAQYTRNTMSYINYSAINGYPVQGNFLSFYPELAWAIALLTPKSDIEIIKKEESLLELHRLEAIRYTNKVYGYHKAGIEIVESKKLTGFEEVKLHFQKISGDGWEFEKRFRTPLENLFIKNKKTQSFVYNEGVEELINIIQSNN